VAFADSVREVTILKEGNRRVILPKGTVWDDYFEQPGADLDERAQPPTQVRDAF
jgi:antitoxin VapB